MLEILINIAIFWITFIIGNLFSFYFVKYVTPHIKYWTAWDAYPFICEKCMTTWTLLSLYVMVGLLINSILFIILGVLLSLGFGFGKYLLEKERMKEEVEEEAEIMFNKIKEKFNKNG